MDPSPHTAARMGAQMDGGTIYTEYDWTDDGLRAFDDAVRAEALRQIASNDDTRAELLSEKIMAADIRLMSNPAAFTARCAELLAEASEDFAGTIVERVRGICDEPKWADHSVAELVQYVVGDTYSPWAPGAGP